MRSLDILIPCKAFEHGKSRLAGELAPRDRVALCRRLLQRTVEVSRDATPGGRVAVVSDDAGVLATAAGWGAETVRAPSPGLNAALKFANRRLLDTLPAADLIVLPIDLPHVTAPLLREIARRRADMVIAPDLQGVGTNLLMLRARARPDFPFSYGTRSFDTHVAIAAERRYRLAIVRDERLGFDVDEPIDLAALSRGESLQA